MIIVEGWVGMSPADIEQLRPAARAMIAASKAEDGCLEYSYAQDLADPAVLRVSERWRDQAALDRHLQTPHMASFTAAAASTSRTSASVRAYTTEFDRTLIED